MDRFVGGTSERVRRHTVPRDREATPLDLPEADEIVLSPDGVMYACWFENESFRVQAYRFEAETFKPAGQPCVVNVHNLHGEDLVVLDIPGGVELRLEPEFHV